MHGLGVPFFPFGHGYFIHTHTAIYIRDRIYSTRVENNSINQSINQSNRSIDRYKNQEMQMQLLLLITSELYMPRGDRILILAVAA